MDANSPTTTKRATTAERKKNALAYRIGGKSFREIGELLGVSTQAAHALVVKALDDTNAQIAENAEQLRRLELERLDFMRNALWSAVIKGDVLAIDRAIKISKRISELTGIDAPAKQDITSGGDKIIVTLKGDDE